MTVVRGQARPFEQRHRVHHCFRCSKETQQSWLYTSNGNHPEIDHWACSRCGTEFFAMGDPRRGGVGDGEGLCRFVLNERIRTRRTRGEQGDDADQNPHTRNARVARLDYDDAIGHLREALLVAWIRFDPARGVPFAAYATGSLRSRLSNWYRTQLGRVEDCPDCTGKDINCSKCGGSGKVRPNPNPISFCASSDFLTLGLDDDGAGDAAGGDPVGAALGGGVEDDRDDSLAALERALLRRDRRAPLRAGGAPGQ